MKSDVTPLEQRNTTLAIRGIHYEELPILGFLACKPTHQPIIKNMKKRLFYWSRSFYNIYVYSNGVYMLCSSTLVIDSRISSICVTVYHKFLIISLYQHVEGLKSSHCTFYTFEILDVEVLLHITCETGRLFICNTFLPVVLKILMKFLH